MILKNNFNFSIFDNLPIGILILSKDETFLYANQHAKNIFKDQNLSHNFEKNILSSLETLKNHNSLLNISATEYEEHGTTFKFIFLNKSEIDEDKINLVRSMEEQLFQYKNLASIGTMISGIAHELNNPISGISMSYQMAQKITESLKNYLENNNPNTIDPTHITQKLNQINSELLDIKTNVVKSSRLIGDLLGFSKKERLELSHCHLKDLISDIINFSYSQNNFKFANIKLTCPNSIQLCCDKLKIQQAFFNILKNSVEAIVSSPDINIFCTTNNNLISIDITDKGSGIPNEILNQIFNPFFTTKGLKGGTGLGLSISQRIIERHGGKITAKSIPGSTTTFNITLPNNLE